MKSDPLKRLSDLEYLRQHYEACSRKNLATIITRWHLKKVIRILEGRC